MQNLFIVRLTGATPGYVTTGGLSADPAEARRFDTWARAAAAAYPSRQPFVVETVSA